MRLKEFQQSPEEKDIQFLKEITESVKKSRSELRQLLHDNSWAIKSIREMCAEQGRNPWI